MVESNGKSKKNIEIIYEEIGEFGKYQITVLLLVSFVLALTSPIGLAYVFTASDLNYRCEIPQCNSINSSQIYNPIWLKNVVPFRDGVPSQCYRYELKDGVTDCNSLDNVNQNVVLKCDKFVYETEEITILNEFDLQCDENKWKLPMVGTMHNVGYFFNLMVVGWFADKFGRKKVIIISTLFAIISGTIKSFSINYWMFLAFEFIVPLCCGGMFITGFILSVELLSTKYRSVGGAICFLSGPFSKTFLGAVAWIFYDWKWIIRFTNIIALFVITYFWILPESVRWLLTKQRYREAADILIKAAKINQQILPPETVDILNNRPEDIKIDDTKKSSGQSGIALIAITNYPRMIYRVLICSYLFMTCTFVFYGLSLHSIALCGNKFTDFIWVSLIELPAEILYLIVSNRLERKIILSASLFLSGISLFCYIFTPDVYWINLVLYLGGKFGITIAYVVIYIFVSEIFPTEFRQSLFGTCSGIGRIGSMVAPQVSLFAYYWKPLPMLLFGTTTILAGFLCFLLPETFNKKLPDTMDEALKMGNKKKCNKN